MEIVINGEKRDLYIEYKKKKKVSVTISPEGFLTVRAPLGISQADLQKTLESLVPRIEKRLDKIADAKKVYEEGSFNDQDHFKLFGDYVAYSDYGLDPNNIVEMKKFYTGKLREVLEEFLAYYSKKMRVSYRSYKINEVKTNWGTCNSEKNLTFNLKLAMAPKEVIEYVVVHELAHLKHMNHDRSFWSFVGRFMADYKEKEGYLKKYGLFMNL